MFTSYSVFILRVLRIPRGTLLSSYIQLYTAFTISGLFHAISVYSLPFTHGYPQPDHRYRNVIAFFVIQAVGITFEDAVIGLFGPKCLNWKGRHWWMWRIVGYLWVAGWFWKTLPLGIDANVQGGFCTRNPAMFPIVEKVLGMLKQSNSGREFGNFLEW
jgi:Membrane bound O-acyl transferase family